MSEVCPDAINTVNATDAATAQAASLDELGQQLVHALTGRIAFDRFNIGLIDMTSYQFEDAFVVGQNVSGRTTGHLRTLQGSVVEAAIQAGDGFYFGDTDRQHWLERFPRFGPVLDSGIRAMMAVPLRDRSEVFASLVFASVDPSAYSPKSLSIAKAVGKAVSPRINALR